MTCTSCLESSQLFYWTAVERLRALFNEEDVEGGTDCVSELRAQSHLLYP